MIVASIFSRFFHDTVEPHQPLHVFSGHASHPLGVEIAKALRYPLPFSEDRDPAQAGLVHSQDEKLEKFFSHRSPTGPTPRRGISHTARRFRTSRSVRL